MLHPAQRADLARDHDIRVALCSDGEAAVVTARVGRDAGQDQAAVVAATDLESGVWNGLRMVS